MLILTNDDVNALLTLEDTIDALRISNREVQAFKGHERYRLNRPRTNHYLPWSGSQQPQSLAEAEQHSAQQKTSYNFKSMEGGSLHYGVWALRSSSDLVVHDVGAFGPTHRYLRYGDLPGQAGYSDLIFLYNIHNAQFEAIIHSAALQGMRVAATSALGTDVMARPDVQCIGVFGSGWQAAANLRAMLRVRPSLRTVRVFSPNAEHRERFASRMRGELNLDVQAVATPEAAVLGMDIICEASSARTPVFEGELLQPGQHVVSVGAGDEVYHRRLLDVAAVSKCNHVAAHSLEVRFGLEEIEDTIATGHLDPDSVLDLPTLLSDPSAIEVGESDITFFKNNVGLGTQFAAVGGLLLQKAKARQIGTKIAQDLVSQVMTR